MSRVMMNLEELENVHGANIETDFKKGVKTAGDAIAWAGGQVIDGVKYVGENIVDGACWVGGKVADGASWVGNQVSDGCTWFCNKLRRFFH